MRVERIYFISSSTSDDMMEQLNVASTQGFKLLDSVRVIPGATTMVWIASLTKRVRWPRTKALWFWGWKWWRGEQ